MSLLAVYASLLVAGLGSSLHCAGMCGPILIGFAPAFAAAKAGKGSRPGLVLDFAGYHLGRIWTYALLGLAAGLLGDTLGKGSLLAGLQRQVGLAAALLTIASGLVLAGVVPLPRLAPPLAALPLEARGLGALRGAAWYRTLVASRGILPRLLLGAVMGLLPCGLVWAMLVAAAALRDPLAGALAMIAFGLGTVPSLTAVLVLSRALPPGLRRQGTRIAGAAVAAAGAFMLARAWLVTAGHCPP